MERFTRNRACVVTADAGLVEYKKNVQNPHLKIATVCCNDGKNRSMTVPKERVIVPGDLVLMYRYYKYSSVIFQ
jgi:hypothetical protein